MSAGFRLGLLPILLVGSSVQAAPTAQGLVEKSLLAFYYQGADMQVRARMDLIDRGGGRRTRVLSMLRRDQSDGGNQKYFLYFHEPGDVRGVSFLVWKYPTKDDDRWFYLPSLDLVRRVAADDRRSSFVGSDFTYEDVSGRDLEADKHVFEREEKIGGRDSYLVKSTPKGADADFGYKFTWVDKANFLPLKEEQYDRRGARYKQFTADEVADVKGQPTVVKRTMKNLQSGHRTEVAYLKIVYDLGIEDSLFSERFLRQPPRKWVD
jgi:hypothetical protein